MFRLAAVSNAISDGSFTPFLIFFSLLFLFYELISLRCLDADSLLDVAACAVFASEGYGISPDDNTYM